MFTTSEEILFHLKENPVYNILNTNEHLKNRIILMGLGGSYAYGTYRETSDLDVRGIVLERPSEIIGVDKFSEFVDDASDTTFWGFNRILELLTVNNPNTLELLGLRPEHYFIKNEIGEKLLENKDKFLSQLIVKTFAGFSDQQLRRLQNAMAREMPQAEKEFHILNSIMNQSYCIKGRYKDIDISSEEMGSYVDFASDNLNNIYRFEGDKTAPLTQEEGMVFNGATRKLFDLQRKFKEMNDVNEIRFYVDKSSREDMDCEIFFDAIFHHYPLRDYYGITSEMKNTVTDYDKLGKRNKKKDDAHLNKHMAKLVHVILEGIYCMEHLDMKSYLDGEDLKLYMSILNGNFRRTDGSVDMSFYDMLNELMSKFEKLKKETALPALPNYEWINDFRMDVNKSIVNGYSTKLF